MQAAGAAIVERTGEDAVVGMPGLAKIREHERINQRIAAFLRTHRVDVHVPVDSPAANFPICKIAKAAGCRVIHLVAPQIWAWGRWRIHKLRRLTDLVLCLLPFEERFFIRRRVPARFIGHMLFDRVLDAGELDAIAGAYPAGTPRLAMMPGSRPAEHERNWPLLLGIYRGLKARFPGAAAVVAATSPAVADELRRLADRHGGWPEGVHCAVRQTDAVIRWCDLALVKSGTVTLQVTKQNKPMVIFYKQRNWLFYSAARVVLATKHFALPNVIAARRIVPEFVPHFGGPEPIVRAATELIENTRLQARQKEELASVVAQFQGRHAGSLAADAIESALGLDRPAEAAAHAPAAAPAVTA
jgi:lipid-A-disaccharide synthase